MIDNKSAAIGAAAGVTVAGGTIKLWNDVKKTFFSELTT